MTYEVGTTFQHSYADGYVTFEVIDRGATEGGTEVYVAISRDEHEYDGVVQAFTSDQIARAKRYETVYEKGRQ